MSGVGSESRETPYAPDYLRDDPFHCDSDETEIKLRRVSVVKIRKEQTCVPPPAIGKEVHAIQRGSYARCESALVEGVWAKCYTCLGCMDIWLSPPFEGRG